MLASSCGHDDTVLMLLNHANSVILDQVDDGGQSSLFHAAASGHASTCGLLLEYGADTEIVEHVNGLTPLLWAANEGHERVVEVLLGFGANRNYAHSITGDTAISLATRRNHQGVLERLTASHQSLLPTTMMHYETEISHQTYEAAVPTSYTPSDLHSLLVSLNLQKYSENFSKNGVDIHQFSRLNDTKLKELGVKLIGPRKKMLAAIKRLKL